MTYTIRRIGIRSAAKVAFVCLIISTLPMIPVFWAATSMSTTSFGRTPPGPNFAALAGALAIPLLYAISAAIGAAILTLIYNISVRFHGGIKLDIELQETPLEGKAKN